MLASVEWDEEDGAEDEEDGEKERTEGDGTDRARYPFSINGPRIQLT